MGFLDNMFGGKDGDKKKGGNDGKNPLNQLKNQLSKIGAGQRNFQGAGQSLGGSKPGTVISVSLSEPGPLGIKIEKRPNSEGTAIIALVVKDSQAERAGLQRGDIMCFAGSNGQDEIMYDMVLELASSDQRPLQFDIRRIKRVGNAAAAGAVRPSTANKKASAETHHRKQAMIAAAEAREKAHKAKQKPVARSGLGVGVKYKNEEQKRIEAERLEQMKAQPESAEAQKARAAAKAQEAKLAAELGYNPYETAKATAGQARTATTATQHGTIQADAPGTASSSGGGGMAPLPTVASPADPTQPHAESSALLMEELPLEFQDAFSTLVSTNEAGAVNSSLDIIQKLVTNATTKGQDENDPEKAAKFRRVRLSNTKINAALVQMEGAVELMMSIGFQLHHEDGEDYLIYPPHTQTQPWAPSALSQIKAYGSK